MSVVHNRKLSFSLQLLFVSLIRHETRKLNCATEKPSEMENYLRMETESFSAFLPDFPSFSYQTEVCVNRGGVVGGWWAVERWESLLSKGLRTKQETIPLFWLVLATSVWNLKDWNSHAMLMSVLRSEHAHTHIHAYMDTHVHTQWSKCAACLVEQRHESCEAPIGCYEERMLNRLNIPHDSSVTLVESRLMFYLGQSAADACVFVNLPKKTRGIMTSLM